MPVISFQLMIRKDKIKLYSMSQQDQNFFKTHVIKPETPQIF